MGFEPGTGPGRRALLRRAVGLFGAGAGLGLGRRASAQVSAPAAGGGLPPAVPAWMRVQGAPILSHPYGQPSAFEAGVVRRARRRTLTPTAASSTTPLQDLHGIVIPSGLHFERHHAGVPAIDPGRHRLMVHGLVERPLIFSMDDLVRFPAVSRLCFIECAGNSSWVDPPPGATVQDIHGLISCSEWTGVLLSTVLAETGLAPGAAWALAEGADAAGMTRSIPITKALDDAILAWAQNGERLRPEQGYPLRLVLPGFEGNMNVKWLRRLKVGDKPFEAREETAKYTDLLPDGRARQFSFVMEAKSVITFPSAGQKLKGPGAYEISGLAWSGRGRVARVEVSADGGGTWREATLQSPVLATCLTRFRLPWSWEGGPARLRSRAIDETGYVQPDRAALVAADGLNFGYHYNGVQEWRIGADGEVGHGAT